MPPKAPALKFKPKYIPRSAHIMENEEEFVPHNSSPTNTSTSTNTKISKLSLMESMSEDDINNLNLIQLERLRRQSEWERNNNNNNNGENAWDEESKHITNSGGNDTSNKNVSDINSRKLSRQHGNASVRGEYNATTTTTTTSANNNNNLNNENSNNNTSSRRYNIHDKNNTNEKTSLSAHAQLQRAVERFVDVGAYPEFAPRLPCNTMSSSLCDETITLHSQLHAKQIYNPIPLTHELSTCDNDKLDGEHKIVEGADNGNEERTTAAQRITVDGTQFLRAHLDETQRMHSANQQFINEVIASQSLNEALESENNNAHDMLVWMQLPQFSNDAPFQLDQLLPGKVGELKMMRSGRMIMEIGGVEYEVAVEHETSNTSTYTASSHATNKSKTNNGNSNNSNKGVHAVAVATSTQLNASMLDHHNRLQTGDESSRQWINAHYAEEDESNTNNNNKNNSCVELGVLQQKLICTPLVDKL